MPKVIENKTPQCVNVYQSAETWLKNWQFATHQDTKIAENLTTSLYPPPTLILIPDLSLIYPSHQDILSPGLTG